MTNQQHRYGSCTPRPPASSASPTAWRPRRAWVRDWTGIVHELAHLQEAQPRPALLEAGQPLPQEPSGHAAESSSALGLGGGEMSLSGGDATWSEEVVWITAILISHRIASRTSVNVGRQASSLFLVQRCMGVLRPRATLMCRWPPPGRRLARVRLTCG